MWFSTSRQMIYAIRTHKTRDNVWDALLPNFIGCALYSYYAFVTWQPMFFIGDAVDGAMIGVILYIKMKYKVVEMEEVKYPLQPGRAFPGWAYDRCIDPPVYEDMCKQRQSTRHFPLWFLQGDR